MSRDMKRGAVGFLDALGFKGIWRDYQGGKVIAKMEILADRIRNTERAFYDELRKASSVSVIPNVKTVFLSDTIVIGSYLEGPTGELPSDGYDWLCVSLVADLVASVLSLARSPQPPFAFRGCVELGEFLFSEPFIIGSAVDAAAEGERALDGAIVWLGPTAAHAVEAASVQQGRNVIDGSTIVRARVPRKSSRRRWWSLFRSSSTVDWSEELTVCPFARGTTPERKQEIAEGILSAFRGSRADVVQKRRQTKRYLDEVQEYLRRGSPRQGGSAT